jgi:hypothetical protein
VSVEHEITKRAADGTLTIGELRQFLEEFDKPAVTPECLVNGYGLKVKARVTFRGGLKSVSVTIPGGDEHR